MRTLLILSCVSGEEKEESPDTVIIRLLLHREQVVGRGAKAGTYLPLSASHPEAAPEGERSPGVRGLQLHRGRVRFWGHVQADELWAEGEQEGELGGSAAPPRLLAEGLVADSWGRFLLHKIVDWARMMRVAEGGCPGPHDAAGAGGPGRQTGLPLQATWVRGSGSAARNSQAPR